MRDIWRIIFHWEGNGNSRELDSPEAVERIRRGHIANRWGDIGYHWLIGRSGREYAGRPEDQIGAHCLGANTGSLGICFLFGKQDKALTDAAIETAVERVRLTCGKYSFVPSSKSILGHCDLLATECPGIVYPLIPAIISRAQGVLLPGPLTAPLDTAELRKIKVFDDNGKEYRGILVNSQAYVYAPDAAAIAGKRLEWDGGNKIIKMRRNE